MASYKTHSAFNIILSLPICLLGLSTFFHPSYSLLITFLVTFIYSTFFMTPDLDLVHKIKLISLRGTLTLPFRLYSLVFKHRGISHSLIFGSLTRILWLGGMIVLIFYLMGMAPPSSHHYLAFYHSYKPYIWYAVAGICLADWSHLLLDIKIRR